MSSSKHLARLLGLSLASMALVSAAGSATAGELEPSLGRVCVAMGSVSMPNASEPGMVLAIALDERSGKRYVLEAKLDSLVPGLFDESTRVAMGAMRGRLREVAIGGMLDDAAPLLEAYVEGMWRLEKNLRGACEASIWKLDEAGERVLVGRLQGALDVSRHEAEAALAAHSKRAQYAAEAALAARLEAAKKKKGLGSAASELAQSSSASGLGDRSSSGSGRLLGEFRARILLRD